jgi:hypothetical protein
LPSSGEREELALLRRMFADHERLDSERFATLGESLARLSGELRILIAAVIASGLLNYLGHA